MVGIIEFQHGSWNWDDACETNKLASNFGSTVSSNRYTSKFVYALIDLTLLSQISLKENSMKSLLKMPKVHSPILGGM